MMTWDDVHAMEQTGLVSFGAHTVNHEIVSHLNDSELADEIRQSHEAVREHVARPSRSFAYPNGTPDDFDDRAARELKLAGSKWALTTIDGLSDPLTHPFEIRRVIVENDTTFARFRLAATGFLASMRRFRRSSNAEADAMRVVHV
jgi:peptidoglycan/xylan/chitin deacetylase (PgdA/CDA1 family)